MKPRIFVSSTFYDLKYVREDLASFIRNYGFEPILFEEGDIGYTPGKPLDESCYDAMRTSDLAVLIIGGQYGSKATKQDSKTDKFISITWKEYKNALDQGIPIFAFVDSNVLIEYGIYKENLDTIKKKADVIKFRTTKNIKVFEFIQDVYDAGRIPVERFDKIADIKEFLSKQWSDMMKRYLVQRREKEDIDSIKAQIDKLESLISSMSTMLDEVGRKVITEPNKYEDIKLKQQSEYVFKLIYNNFSFCDLKNREKDKRVNDLINSFISVKSIHLNHDVNRLNHSFSIWDIYIDEIRSLFSKNGFSITIIPNNKNNLEDIFNEIANNLEDNKLKKQLTKEIIAHYNRLFRIVIV